MSASLFEVLGLSEKLSLSNAELTRAFHKKSLALHPDKNKDRDTTALSSEVNRAYRTLRDPWSRGLYVLTARGRVLDRSKPPLSLAELFFECEDEGDPSRLRDLKDRLNRESVMGLQRLQQLFEQIDQEGVQETSLQALHDLLLEHTYRESLLRTIGQKLGS